MVVGRIYGCELNLERGREPFFSKNPGEFGKRERFIVTSTALQLNVATFVIGSDPRVTAVICWKKLLSFRHDQDWGDGGMTEVVQRQFQLNLREFMKAFVQDAIARVVKPDRQLRGRRGT